jgi:hypothetical protein
MMIKIRVGLFVKGKMGFGDSEVAMEIAFMLLSLYKNFIVSLS